jgi:hypothetical protein
LRAAVSVPAPSLPHPVCGRCGLSRVGRCWPAGVCLGSVTHLDRQARFPRPPIGPGGGGWPRVGGAGGCGRAATGPGCAQFCSGGGFSAGSGRVFLPDSPKTLHTPDTDPTDQVVDDCLSPDRPTDREHVLSKVRRTATAPTRSTTTPHPHITQKSRISLRRAPSLLLLRGRRGAMGYPGLLLKPAAAPAGSALCIRSVRRDGRRTDLVHKVADCHAA